MNDICAVVCVHLLDWNSIESIPESTFGGPQFTRSLTLQHNIAPDTCMNIFLSCIICLCVFYRASDKSVYMCQLWLQIHILAISASIFKIPLPILHNLDELSSRKRQKICENWHFGTPYSTLPCCNIEWIIL